MGKFKVMLAGAAALLASSQALAFIDGKYLLATPEFESGETRPVSIALLPVETNAAKAKVVDTEALVGESAELAAMLNAEFEARLEALGYTVRALGPEEINADRRLQEYVLDARRAYEEATKRVKRRKMKRRMYDAGDEVRLLADYLDVDAIAFTRVDIVAATGGRKAVALLTGLGGVGATNGAMGIVDGNSGVLEALASGLDQGSGSKKLEEDPQREMARIAELITAKLPEADPAARAEPSGDEDVLADVEALLEQ